MPALKIFSSFRAGGILDVKRIQRTRMAEDAVNLPEGTPRELTEEELVKVFACCKCRSAQIDSVQHTEHQMPSMRMLTNTQSETSGVGHNGQG